MSTSRSFYQAHREPARAARGAGGRDRSCSRCRRGPPDEQQREGHAILGDDDGRRTHEPVVEVELSRAIRAVAAAASARHSRSPARPRRAPQIRNLALRPCHSPPAGRRCDDAGRQQRCRPPARRASASCTQEQVPADPLRERDAPALPEVHQVARGGPVEARWRGDAQQRAEADRDVAGAKSRYSHRLTRAGSTDRPRGSREQQLDREGQHVLLEQARDDALDGRQRPAKSGARGAGVPATNWSMD